MANRVNELLDIKSGLPDPYVSVKARTGKTFNIKQSQWFQTGTDSQQVVVTVNPATACPSVWSSFIVDFNIPRGICDKLKNIVLNMNLSGSGDGVNMLAMPYWIQYIDFYLGATQIQRVYNFDLMLQNCVVTATDDFQQLASVMNINSSTFANLASPATSSNVNYYMPLACFLDQCNGIFMGGLNADIRVRIQMQTFANASASGIVSDLAINSMQLLLNTEKLSEPHYNYYMQQYQNNKLTLKFLTTNLLNKSIGTITSGNTYTQQFSGITGETSHVWVLLRNTGSLTGTGQNTYTALQTLNLLNGGGNSIIGGQPLTSSYLLKVLPFYQWKTLAFNNLNLYCYSFAHDPQNSEDNCYETGSYNFSGNEQLQFVAGATQATEVNILARTYCVLELDKGNPSVSISSYN